MQFNIDLLHVLITLIHNLFCLTVSEIWLEDDYLLSRGWEPPYPPFSCSKCWFLVIWRRSQWVLCCVVGRSSVSGRICHGGHRSRRHLSGHPGQRRRAAGGREEEHPQTSGRGVLLWEDLQTQWVSPIIQIQIIYVALKSFSRLLEHIWGFPREVEVLIWKEFIFRMLKNEL